MAISVSALPDVPSHDYNIIRPQIHSGDILLCSGSSLFSSLIQQATQSIWSHVGFIMRLDAINRIMVLESVESIGVRTVPLSCYASNYNGTGKGYPGKVLIARHAAFKPQNIGNLSRHAVDLFGYPYDKDEIVRIALKIGMRTFAFPENAGPPQAGRAFICSEYAYDCYKSVGIQINYDTSGFVAPADFAKTPEIHPVGFVNT